MNTPNNTPINTEKKTRGRPRIHEDKRALWRSTKKTWRENHPEKYLENANRKRPPTYCAVCEKYCEYHAYKKHLVRRNHLKALAKKLEETFAETGSIES